MISSLLLLTLGWVVDSVVSIVFNPDFALRVPVITTFFMFNFWILANLRLESRFKIVWLIVTIIFFEMTHQNSFGLYGFTLFILYYFFLLISKTLHQSYFEQFTLLNIMSFIWMLVQFSYASIFNIIDVSFETFFSISLFPNALIQIFVSLVSLTIMVYVDRYQLKKDMIKRNQEYLSYRGQR